MCRCCQNCWEEFYWNCFEEKFCYDDSIANYNPEEDEDFITERKNCSIINHIQTADNNNSIQIPKIIVDQPLGRGNSSGILSNAKIHEEDYRRETQTNVPMLGPEILAVFANSQIFQDHQPTKLNRISTKSHFVGTHSPSREKSTSRESEQDRLMRKLEGNKNSDTISSEIKQKTEIQECTAENYFTLTLTTDSSPDGCQIITSKKFDAIAEEEATADGTNYVAEVILRPRLIERHPHLLPLHNHHHSQQHTDSTKKSLRLTKSVPHFNVRAAASETDIFAISGSGQISMTPEVPFISFSNLPKNYEDTPTIEKYRVSRSLYSIQTANAARATQDDYSMPRYFRRSAMLSQSTEMLASQASLAASNDNCRPEKEKSKRLQMLRGNLPPLLIHSVSFRKTRDEGKQVN